MNYHFIHFILEVELYRGRKFGFRSTSRDMENMGKILSSVSIAHCITGNGTLEAQYRCKTPVDFVTNLRNVQSQMGPTFVPRMMMNAALPACLLATALRSER